MTVYKNNIDRIEIISNALKDLNDEVIFIGGSCIQFYVENPEIINFRPTVDIDFTIKVYTYPDFNKFNKDLSSLGFVNDTSKDAPIIRWKFKDIKVDIIPDKASIVGFRDIEWFKEGRGHSFKYELPSGRKINLLSLPYFFATKFEASDDRGNKDYLVDHDLEDIMIILDGRKDFLELLEAPDKVKAYLSGKFNSLISDKNFINSLSYMIDFDETAVERAKIVLEKIEKWFL